MTYLTKIENLLAKNGFFEVKNLRILEVFSYSEFNLTKLIKIVKDKRISEISNLKKIDKEHGDEALILFEYSNKHGEICLFLVYDTFELWDDPKIVEI